MVGTTRCPGTSRVKTISFDLHGLLRPHGAYMTVDSSAAAFLEMSVSSTPYNTDAMIITAAMDMRPSKPWGKDREFFMLLLFLSGMDIIVTNLGGPLRGLR